MLPHNALLHQAAIQEATRQDKGVQQQRRQAYVCQQFYDHVVCPTRASAEVKPTTRSTTTDVCFFASIGEQRQFIVRDFSDQIRQPNAPGWLQGGNARAYMGGGQARRRSSRRETEMSSMDCPRGVCDTFDEMQGESMCAVKPAVMQVDMVVLMKLSRTSCRLFISKGLGAALPLQDFLVSVFAHTSTDA